MQRFRWVSWSLLAATLPFGVGCSNSAPAASSKLCAADEAVACVTDSGCRGYKHCNADGNGYGPCDCSLTSITPQAGAASIVTAAGGGGSVQGGASGSTTAGSSSVWVSAGGGVTDTFIAGGAGQGGASISTMVTSTGGAPTAGASSTLGTRRAKRCDANGDCKCISLASF